MGLLSPEVLLCYFLNKPNQKAKNLIEYLSKKYNLNVYFINKDFDDYHIIYGGPIEFLNYIKNAKFVVTDSFHGVAFSINFNKQFYVFERNYITESQSTRILSLLKKIKLENVYESDKEIDNYNYDKINQIMSVEREKSLNYLIHSISEENIDESK